MAVHSFSTKDTRPSDGATVAKAKQYCDENNIVFSAFVVKLLREWEAKHAGSRQG